MKKFRNESNAMTESSVPDKGNKEFDPLNSFKNSKGENYHDSVITEDSIRYFNNKLKNKNSGYKLYSYICLATYFLDLLVCFTDKKFKNLFNIFIILLMIGLIIYHLFLFKHNFETISREIYKETQKLIYIQYIAVTLFYLDLLIIAYQIFFLKNDVDVEEKEITFITFILYFVCILSSIFFPGYLLVKLIQLKKCVKDLSIAKGEVYDEIQSWEVGIKLDQETI